MKTFIVDAFTDVPFAGNPAGVQFVESFDAVWMQAVARELGLSETAFIRRQAESNNFGIRYFSPKMQIPLCGHATLAAAKVLFEHMDESEVCFSTGSGILLRATKRASLIEMEFPLYKVVDSESHEKILAALGIDEAIYWGFNEELGILMIEIESPEQLVSLKPDYVKLLKSHTSIAGVVVTSQGSGNYDFYSRYFWPWSGTNEDPVTGGTHTFLANYWANKLGKKKLLAFQASERGGWMEVEKLSGKSMAIRGNACIVLTGEMQPHS